jgi:Tfp pilus assembly protein FimT
MRAFMNNFFNIKGYTIIELAVVLVIIILIYSSVSVSSMYLFPQHAKADVKQIISDFIWARIRAVSNQTSSCFAFNDPSVASYTYAIYNGTCGSGGAMINNSSLSSFVCSPDIDSCIAVATAGAFNISVNNMSASPSGIAGTFSLPSGLSQMRINVKFINSTEGILLFNSTGFVRTN